MQLASVAFFANDPSASDSLMMTTPCGTVRPLPMLRWPTSLLPITPVGRPTGSPLASSSAIADTWRECRSHVGVCGVPQSHSRRLPRACPSRRGSRGRADLCGRVRSRGHAGPDAASTIAANEIAERLAPPMRPPSICGLREQRRRILGLHAAAVQDAGVARDPAPQRTNRRNDGISRRSGVSLLPGADRPDRFVGDGTARDVGFGRDAFENASRVWLTTRSIAIPSSCSSSGLADRNDRRELVMRDAARTLRLTLDIGFVVTTGGARNVRGSRNVTPMLERASAARYLARVRAVILRRSSFVLRGLMCEPVELFVNGGQRGERRSDRRRRPSLVIGNERNS